MTSEEPAYATAAIADPELLHSLSGFILALTAKGKLAYISENVTHFLGFSVVSINITEGEAPHHALYLAWTLEIRFGRNIMELSILLLVHFV